MILNSLAEEHIYSLRSRHSRSEIRAIDNSHGKKAKGKLSGKLVGLIRGLSQQTLTLKTLVVESGISSAGI